MVDVVDCLALQNWASELELYDYFPPAWREYLLAHTAAGGGHSVPVGDPGGLPRRVVGPLSVLKAYRNPLGDQLPEDQARGGAALTSAHLDRNHVGRVILCHGDALLSVSIPTTNLAAEAARAINDWTADKWLTTDPRLKAAVIVPTQLPEMAAAEIRRCAENDGFVGVLMGSSGLAKPFGHPVYNAIHEAAHDVGLPILLVAGGHASYDAVTLPVTGGVPSTYAEYRALMHQSLQAHIASLITLGVMARYPSLKFLVLGGGFTWLTPWLWRLDTNHRAFRLDSVWLRERLPSDVFREHFMIGTHPFHAAADESRIRAYLQVDDGLADLVCYASGYPEWDSTTPGDLLRALPDGWGEKVFRTNAMRFFGWTENELGAAG